MTDSKMHSIPKEPGRWRAITLAAVVHAALLALLWFGVHWQNETPVSVEAEVWSPQTREAAAKPPPKESESKPEPKPERKPEPKPVLKEPPKPPVDVPKIAKPDIALEQEKKRKVKELKAHQEEARLERKKVEDKRLAQEAVEKKMADDKRHAQEKNEAAAKKKRDADLAKKEAAEKKKKQDAEEEKQIAKTREDELRRLSGATGSGLGEAPKSTGSRDESGYAQRIGAKIKSNINYIIAEDLPGNPPVEYLVELLPDGSISGIRKIKSSGIPGFDEAVRRAIEKSQPYPKDKSGTVPPSFKGTHKPKDQ